MALHGSSIPLDGGGFVTTIICPNNYSHGRLRDFIHHLSPEAGEPSPPPDPAATEALRERVEAADAEDLGLRAGQAWKPEEFAGCEGTDSEDESDSRAYPIQIRSNPEDAALDALIYGTGAYHAIQGSTSDTGAGAQSGKPLNMVNQNTGD